MNNRLTSSFDEHSQSRIFESKHNTHFGFAQFLPCNSKRYYVQTRTRYIKNSFDDFFTIDFRIDSIDFFHIGQSEVSFIIDGQSFLIPFSDANLSYPVNFPRCNCNTWGYCVVNKEFIRKICESNELKIRLFISRGFIDINLDAKTSENFKIMCKHIYNGVIDPNQYLNELRTKLPNAYPAWKIFFKQLGFANTLFYVLLIISIPIAYYYFNRDQNNNQNQILGENRDSYTIMDSKCGCNSRNSEPKRKDIFYSEYRDKWSTYFGQIEKIENDKLFLNCDLKGSSDVIIEFSNPSDIYNLKIGSFIDIKLVLREQGGCIQSYKGDNGKIIEIIESNDRIFKKILDHIQDNPQELINNLRQ